jgi:outer membrane protein assembly factor BamB
VWESDVLRNKFQSCILYEGHLYSSDEEGLKCVEFLTGQEKWHSRRQKHGTIVLAEGHLYFLSQEGQLQIIPATPAPAEPVSKVSILDDRCWTVPVICNGQLYARNLERVVCLDLTP